MSTWKNQMRQTQKAIISSIFSLEMHFSFNTNEKKIPAFLLPKGGETAFTTCNKWNLHRIKQTTEV